jgi:hypothetical protein
MAEFSEELQTAIGNVNLIMDILSGSEEVTHLYTIAILAEIIKRKYILTEELRSIGEMYLVYVELQQRSLIS